MILPELDQPWHELSESKLGDVLKQLEEDDWGRLATSAAEEAKRYFEFWRSSPERTNYRFAFYPPRNHHAMLQQDSSYPPILSFIDIQIAVPHWVPEEYVEAIAERMIYEQLEAA